MRVLRVIARLNVGGPAIQAISLTSALEARGYATTLVRGSEDPHEGSMDYLAAALGVEPVHVRALRRDLGRHDVRALAQLILLVTRHRPQIVHTHAAKAGTLGRLAALLACALPGAPARRRPLIVHTFHGHSLTGYFGSRRARVFLAVEKALARRSDRLIAVSEEVRDELVALGVAERERFEVIPLGFDLARFDVSPAERARRRAALRDELEIAPHARVVTLVARLVPIKRVDRFLRVAELVGERDDVHFLILGDGELGAELRASAPAARLGARVTWAGFRRDMPDVCFASDVVVLCSDNEGTPVSLIEAQAAAVPVVSTRVGGVASVVLDARTGLLAAPEDEVGLAAAIGRVLDDSEFAQRLAAGAMAHARSYSLEALVQRIDRLYTRLLEQRAPHKLSAQ